MHGFRINPHKYLSVSSLVTWSALVLLWCLCTSTAWAGCTGSSPTWTSTPDYGSVSTCVANAIDGDTINISAGSATWNSTLSWSTKGLSIIGAGQGTTNVTNGVGTPMIRVTNTGTNFTRISGMTILGTDSVGLPAVSLIGPISAVRIDHITFNKGDAAISPNWETRGTGPVSGVVDHCIFLNMKRAYFGADTRTPGDSLNWGTTAWGEYLATTSTYPGSAKLLYFEDDQFTWDKSNTDANAQGAIYGQYGAMVAVRHSTFNGWCTYIDAHGDGPDYGTVYYEIYNNTFHIVSSANCSGAADVVGMRGGQLIAHDNTFDATTDPFHILVYWQPICPGGTAVGNCEFSAHRIHNTYFWNNSWNGDSTQSDLVTVADSGQTDPGYSKTVIRLNLEYFLAAPKSGQTFYPNTPYTYPHPLTSVTSALKPSPPSLLVANVN